MEVITHCIEVWGMAIANLISLFNPQKIILGGGVFGPAVRFIPLIREQASRWAQPISMKKVTIEPSQLGDVQVYLERPGCPCKTLKRRHESRI